MTTAAENCSEQTERKGLPLGIRRMMGLTTAGELLGVRNLADAMSISERTLRYKTSAERGISDTDLALAAGALEARAQRLLEHARKLRAERDGEHGRA